MDLINVPSKISSQGGNEDSKMFLSLLEAYFSAVQRKSFFDTLKLHHFVKEGM